MTETPETLRTLAHSIPELAPNVDLFDIHAAAWEDDILRADVYDENYQKERKKRVDVEAERDALRELIDAERNLPLMILPDYDDPRYMEKHERARRAREVANMPLPAARGE